MRVLGGADDTHCASVGRQPYGHSGGRARILLVDDDEEVGTVTSDMIGELGYRIEAVSPPVKRPWRASATRASTY